MATERKSVWLVTGCSSGFGRQIAEHLLDRGERVVVTARKPEQVEDLAKCREALVLPLDVTDPEQAQAAVSKAEARFGGIDVLVNNAGLGYFAAIEESDDDAVRTLFEVNFFGVATMIRAALPGMRRRRAYRLADRHPQQVGVAQGPPGQRLCPD